MGVSLGGLLPPLSLIPGLPGLTSILTSTSSLSPSPVMTPAPEASPPPSVVYEPGPSSQDEEALTYSPPDPVAIGPSPEDGNESEPEGVAAQGDGASAQTSGNDAAPRTEDFAPVVIAMLDPASLHAQFVLESRGVPVASGSPIASLSVEVARAAQSFRTATPQPAAATLPSLVSAEPAAARPAPAQTQSQVMAQAVYSLVADAWVQDRSVLDFIKFA